MKKKKEHPSKDEFLTLIKEKKLQIFALFKDAKGEVNTPDVIITMIVLVGDVLRITKKTFPKEYGEMKDMTRGLLAALIRENDIFDVVKVNPDFDLSKAKPTGEA